MGEDADTSGPAATDRVPGDRRRRVDAVGPPRRAVRRKTRPGSSPTPPRPVRHRGTTGSRRPGALSRRPRGPASATHGTPSRGAARPSARARVRRRAARSGRTRSSGRGTRSIDGAAGCGPGRRRGGVVVRFSSRARGDGVRRGGQRGGRGRGTPLRGDVGPGRGARGLSRARCRADPLPVAPSAHGGTEARPSTGGVPAAGSGRALPPGTPPLPTRARPVGRAPHARPRRPASAGPAGEPGSAGPGGRRPAEEVPWPWTTGRSGTCTTGYG